MLVFCIDTNKVEMNGTEMSSPSQSKDPAFKLFGKNISMTDTQIPVIPQFKVGCRKMANEETVAPGQDHHVESNESGGETKGNQASARPNGAEVAVKPKEEQAETSCTEQERVLKLRDRVLPCPRCNSLETKFCYFNNYNVNQPRHFCKNCQRYWTAGGTMRNVPIGAGRRKNKHLASQYHQVLVSSDGIPITSMENSDSGIHVSSVESQNVLSSSMGKGMVLKFGSEQPLCESMETVLNLGDQNRHGQDNAEEPSICGALTAVSSTKVNQLPENVTQKEQTSCPGSLNMSTSQHSLPFYPLPTWIFPWNPAWNDVAPMAAMQPACIPSSQSSNQVQWCPTPMLAVPGFCPPNIPLQFVPATHLGCTPILTAGTGNLLMGGSNGCQSPSSSTSTSCCSGNGSPTLGKHSRDASIMDEGKTENCIVVPKTLRIDEPNEASKTPHWSALGLKPQQKDLVAKGSIFKTFKSKGEVKGHASDAHYILEANPAALSRSHTFQERS